MAEEKITALQVAILDKGMFSEEEAAALELADRMAASGHAVSEELWDRLKGFYDDGQLVELVSVIGLFNYFNRVNDTLKVDITR